MPKFRELFIVASVAALIWSPVFFGAASFGQDVSNPQTNAGALTTGTLPNARLPTGVPGVITSLRSANFNSTADQAIAIPARITAFQITSIVVTNCSANLTTAAGGVYPTTSKGGTPIVAAIQVYTALTGATVLLPLTVAATPLATRYTVANIYLSLTTGQGTAATCDVFILGSDLT